MSHPIMFNIIMGLLPTCLAYDFCVEDTILTTLHLSLIYHSSAPHYTALITDAPTGPRHDAHPKDAHHP